MLVVTESGIHQNVGANRHKGSHKTENDTGGIPFHVIETTLLPDGEWNKNEESYTNNHLHENW